MDYSLSDLKAIMGDNNGPFGGGGLQLVVILFQLFVMFGGWGNNQRGELDRYATAASQQEILFGQQFSQINDRLKVVENNARFGDTESQAVLVQLG